MTKSEELAALDGFIASLPADTYLGPWLRQVRGEVERMIRSDIFPDVSLAEVAARCLQRRQDLETLEADAKARISRHGDFIIAAAKKNAATITAAAERDAERTRRYLADSISGLRRSLAELG